MYLFTSEFVSAGHPDKCADYISDSILDYVLKHDSKGKVACEVLLAGKNIVVGGEITANCPLDDDIYKKLVKDAIIKIGYDGNNGFSKEECLHPEELNINIFINKQSNDINMGVVHKNGEIGAGDQGIMFGFAINETKNYMPSAITYARLLCQKAYEFAKNHNDYGVDIKTQVTMDYGNKDNFESCNPQKIDTIVISIPSVSSVTLDEVKETVRKEIIEKSNLPKELFNQDECKILINPTKKYVNHSALHDSGLTGRKLIVDSFGGYAPIGGGAQSGKDPTKVDRSGLYAGRYIAKNIVASGVAKKCLIQLSYAIGKVMPVSVNVDTMGTGVVSDDIISNFVKENFRLTPKWIIEKFSLDKPSEDTFLYSEVASQGQVGYSNYPWEKLDKVELFKKLLNNGEKFWI